MDQVIGSHVVIRANPVESFKETNLNNQVETEVAEVRRRALHPWKDRPATLTKDQMVGIGMEHMNFSGREPDSP